MTPKDKVKPIVKDTTTAQKVSVLAPPAPEAPNTASPAPETTPPEKKPMKSVLGRMISMGRSMAGSISLPREFNLEVVNLNMKRTMPLKIRVAVEGV